MTAAEPVLVAMSSVLATASDWSAGLVVMLALMLVSGFFAASETAVFSLSRDELRNLQFGRPRERLVADLLLDPDRVLTAVLFWNLVANLSVFAVSVAIAHRLVSEGRPAEAGVIGAFGLVGEIIFGEVLPKSLAVVFSRRLAPLVSRPLSWSVAALDPLMPGLRRVTRLARRAFWPHLRTEPYLRSEDLERAIDLSVQRDEVIRHERQALHMILDFSEITAEEIMRPRGTYLTFEPPVSLADLNGQVPPSDYILITEPDSENIDRAVPLADFSSIPSEHLERVAEEVVHVPWCATLAFTLQSLRDRLASVASVVNEYGETIGIITYEDLLDTLLVEESSRTRRVLGREPVLEIAPDRYHVEGMTTLRYLARRLEIPDYDPADDPQVTVAGLLQEELERIPLVGDEGVWRGYRIRVIDADPRGQLRAMVSRETPEEPVER